MSTDRYQWACDNGTQITVDAIHPPHALLHDYEYLLHNALEDIARVRLHEATPTYFESHVVNETPYLFTPTTVFVTHMGAIVGGQFENRNDSTQGNFLLIRGEQYNATRLTWMVTDQGPADPTRLLPLLDTFMKFLYPE